MNIIYNIHPKTPLASLQGVFLIIIDNNQKNVLKTLTYKNVLTLKPIFINDAENVYNYR